MKVSFAQVLKANPYHDEKGRFSSMEKAKSVSSWAKFTAFHSTAGAYVDSILKHGIKGSAGFEAAFVSPDLKESLPYGALATRMWAAKNGVTGDDLKNLPVAVVKVDLSQQDVLSAFRAKSYVGVKGGISPGKIREVRVYKFGDLDELGSKAKPVKVLKADVCYVVVPPEVLLKPRKKSAFSY